MGIIEITDFKKELEDLPAKIIKLYQKQKKLFNINWLDSRLHVKRIKEFAGVYSFRITRRYRVLFYFKDSGAVFFKIGHRKDVYEE